MFPLSLLLLLLLEEREALPLEPLLIFEACAVAVEASDGGGIPPPRPAVVSFVVVLANSPLPLPP